MNPILTVILSLLVFEFLIFIHEFGHYITARIFNVTITEFSLGFGPELITYESKKTGIKYKICILPLGGFVAMVGEDEDSDDPNAFNKKPAWQRFIITAAGATVNIVAGFLAMIIIVSFIKIGNTTWGAPMEESVLTELGYEELDLSHRSSDSGLQMGDEIVAVNGKKVKIYDELSYQIMRYGYEPVDLTIIRDGDEMVIYDVSFPTVKQQGQTFGIIDFKITGLKEKNIFSVISLSFRKAALVMRMCWESIIDLLTGRYTLEAVSGPVGISTAIGDAASTGGILSLLNITVLISINLGFMNLVPFPALDGGRLITILIEMITRKKLPAKIEGMINAIGLAILFTFMIIVLFKDVFALIFG